MLVYVTVIFYDRLLRAVMLGLWRTTKGSGKKQQEGPHLDFLGRRTSARTVGVTWVSRRNNGTPGA